MTTLICNPGEKISGEVRVPGDKSISHRSIILSSIANGTSHISGFLQGEDSLNTISAFQQMGVVIKRDLDRVEVQGVGLHGLRAPTADLDLGNSGTAMRLMLGLLAGQHFDSRMIGLSGSYEQVSKAANNFKVSFAVTKSQRNYTVQHTSNIYLLDGQGQLVDIYALNADPDVIASSIK